MKVAARAVTDKKTRTVDDHTQIEEASLLVRPVARTLPVEIKEQTIHGEKRKEAPRAQ